MSTFRIHLSNIYRLGVKELNSLWADKVLLFLIIWAFTAGIYSASKGVSQEIHNAPVAIVDLDHSQISQRLANALTKPYFKKPDLIELNQANEALDKGYYSFSIIIPPSFQRDLQAGRKPNVQLNIDATVMSQAFIGSSYIETIFNNEVNEYFNRSAQTSTQPIQLVTHVRFNPNMTGFWFGGVMEVINNINMLTIILVGAAYIREREHGTLEHLLAMPLGPTEIMISKIWANGLAVLIAASFALIFIIKIVLQVPIAGSIALFIAAAAVYLFSAASIGIFLGTLARSMPQLGLLIFLTIIPLQMLSGGSTPQESMPIWVQNVMKLAPTTYFVRLAQSILYRGAGFSIVWPEFLAIAIIGMVFFFIALGRFRKSIVQG
ncbi:ABC transporter permease [Oxalobacter aliiformigenes]|uniref:ABC transporter permease n=1 Tax=Oxalobacter aliiformigenes TaxID=2946593 RepID=A0A9E9LB83_9BURK|nr:ABC transporter permease [Oxalobacter aliiformigenes]WAV90845.1 ABC transporter permease [Oxalobacter aliiformigenes]